MADDMVQYYINSYLLYLGIGGSVANCLFMGTGNEMYEKEYFQTLLLFAPIHCITIALSGFL